MKKIRPTDSLIIKPGEIMALLTPYEADLLRTCNTTKYGVIERVTIKDGQPVAIAVATKNINLGLEES